MGKTKHGHTAVFTGMFDPVTLGHVDIIRRGSKLFDRLVVAVGVNPDKAALFSLEERTALMKKVTASLPNVEVYPFEGLAVQFVREQGARVILRGVRGGDLEGELTMALANRALDPEIETIFFVADERFTHISSSLIKQIAALGGEAELRNFVPELVVAPLLAKVRKRKEST